MLCRCLGASTGTSVSLTSTVRGSLPPTCARYLLDSTSTPLCARRNPSDLCATILWSGKDVTQYALARSQSLQTWPAGNASYVPSWPGKGMLHHVYGYGEYLDHLIMTYASNKDHTASAT
ncbi:hypothetical protein IWX49DRAFT_556565 [Phyllosticta citricarpa]|uniref:Uncharacterized protein n=1 Tax=Phyllosticta paracitricarpa TaxID=2016321 RepID=A0ABR1MYD1_9PEZI